MAGDVLHDPLGQTPSRLPRQKRWWPALTIAAILVVVLAGSGVWLVRPPPAPANVQTAVVALPTPASQPVAAPSAPEPALAARPADDGAGDTGVKVVTPGGTAPSSGLFIKVPQSFSVTLQPAPDPRLVERSPFGPLPRRGSDGARPADVYARPVSSDANLPAHAPRIAFVVGGMGLNGQSTANAVAQLPPEITLAFAPYGDHLDQQIGKARDAGHEVVLQIPMESLDAQTDDGLSHVLLTGSSGKDTMDRLHWLMGRCVGYVGIANFLGSRFTADAQAFDPVLRDVAARGLLYFDDGSSPRSLASTLAPAAGLRMSSADVVLDGPADATRKSLQKLETLARTRGFALGFASGLPTTVEQIRSFARGLADRGIALVPASALAVEPTRASAATP